MFHRILALVMILPLSLGAAPVAVPAPVPSPPLKQIIDVHSTSILCAAFVTHANGAIDYANRNDITLDNLAANLPHRDMGSGPFAWRSGIAYLTDRTVAINAAWKSGEREINKLRALAAKAKSPAEKKSLMDSANALGGALWRQRKISRDLSGFIAYLNADQTVRDSNAEHLATFDDQSDGSNSPFGQRRIGGTSQWDGAMPTANTHPVGRLDPFHDEELDPNIRADLVRASKSVERQLPAIGSDELRAAAAFTLASQGC